MSTPTHAVTATDLDFALLFEKLMGPAPTPTMWSVSYGGPGARIFNTAHPAAAFIVDESRRRVKSGNPEPVTVSRLDDGMSPDWNASADVSDVLAATGWTARCTEPAYSVAWRLRDDVIDVLESILVPAR